MLDKTLIEEFGRYSPVDIINETFAVLALDLKHCAIFSSPAELDVYLPAPRGVYTDSALEPILNFDEEHYYSAAQHALWLHTPNVRALPDICSYEDFLRASGPIYNKFGKAVLVAHPHFKHIARPEPAYNYGAIHIAYLTIWDHFNRLSHSAKPISNAPQCWHDNRRYVRPEYLQKPLYEYTLQSIIPNQSYQVLEEGEITWNPWTNIALTEMYQDQIDPFIGRELHRLYRFKLHGTMLYIEKGHDIRVVEMQRMIWNHLEQIKHETHLGCHRS